MLFVSPPSPSLTSAPTSNGPTTDTTGPSDATTAIFIIYDIFGFSDQALQGADILAHADSSHQYQVFIPDFFLGKPLSHEDYPPDTEEKKKRLGEFFGGPANPQDNSQKVPKLVKEIGEKYSGIQKWASLGMCWGGKVCIYILLFGVYMYICWEWLWADCCCNRSFR